MNLLLNLQILGKHLLYQFAARFQKESLPHLIFKIILFKGLVHPKMKIMSFITHPHVVSNP